MAPGGAAAAATGRAATTLHLRPSANGPLRKLTTGLLQTYKNINAKYYDAKKARALKTGREDYTAVVGELLGMRYRVEESMGKGSFGQVVSAFDTKTGHRVAVKVIKNKEAFRRQARTEIRLLEMLNRKDNEDQWCIGACTVLLLAAAAATPPTC